MGSMKILPVLFFFFLNTRQGGTYSGRKADARDAPFGACNLDDS